MKPRYVVRRDSFGTHWNIYDTKRRDIIKTSPTRKEARALVGSMNVEDREGAEFPNLTEDGRHWSKENE
jgi:hypothetical protein